MMRYGGIDRMPPEVRDACGGTLDELRQTYLNPDVQDDCQVEFGRCDVAAGVRLLCDEHAFGRDRVVAALERAFGPERIT